MTDTPNTSRDPEELERDIRATQERMSQTVERIGDQLTPRNLFNALLDKAEDNEIDARYLLDGARRNPIALAMIAGGAIWLMSDSDAKLPKRKGRTAGLDADDHGPDPYHRSYLAHMDRVEWREGEDDASYQRRRDMARASYLMVERNQDEDDHGFRQRLDAAAERFREKRHAWADQARSAGANAREQGVVAKDRARDMFQENPLIGGLLAAAVGAIAGASVPMSRLEDERLAEAGNRARGMVDEQKGRLIEKAREKKDELVGQANERLGESAQPQGQVGPDQGRAMI